MKNNLATELTKYRRMAENFKKERNRLREEKTACDYDNKERIKELIKEVDDMKKLATTREKKLEELGTLQIEAKDLKEQKAALTKKNATLRAEMSASRKNKKVLLKVNSSLQKRAERDGWRSDEGLPGTKRNLADKDEDGVAIKRIKED